MIGRLRSPLEGWRGTCPALLEHFHFWWNRVAAIAPQDKDQGEPQDQDKAAILAAINQWLEKLELPIERVGLEAGGLSSWLCHRSLPAGGL